MSFKAMPSKTLFFFLFFFFGRLIIFAQKPELSPPFYESETLWYSIGGISLLVLVGAGSWWARGKLAVSDNKTSYSYSYPQKKNQREISPQVDFDSNLTTGVLTFDADEEMEWFRKKTQTKKKAKKAPSKPVTKRLPKTEEIFAQVAQTSADATKTIQIARKTDATLPLNNIRGLERPGAIEQLPDSSDESLLGAIEQIRGLEGDEEIRALAIRILSAFKTRNAVEALSYAVLYDEHPAIRVAALNALGEVNHESVLETILIACDDYSREVRAAAARVLIRLDINRADAISRIILSQDDDRIAEAASAVLGSGLAERSYERLVHNDYKQVYEAFTILALLIRANAIAGIFKTIATHRDINVRLAVIQVLEILKPVHLLPQLYELSANASLSAEVVEALDNLMTKLSTER
jgi:HEAT repeat protein